MQHFDAERQLCVGRFLGSGMLGSYNRAYQLMALPANLFGQMVERVLFPALAAIQHNIKGLSTVYLRGVAGIALLCLPLSAAALVLAPEVVYVVLGPKWSQGDRATFQILAAGILFPHPYKMSDLPVQCCRSGL
jgi:PST family polysaccharide transporter